MTLQAQPQGLAPPKATVDPTKLNVIYLSWKLPEISNGEILRFILTRDGIELYRGLDIQFSDDTNIMPFRSYTYILSACTVAGCVTSEKITIATTQAPPEDMLPPKLVVINDTTIQAYWTPPAKPNGMIQLYTFLIFGANQSRAYNTTGLSITLTDLQPYSKYSTKIQVCNDIGCTWSTDVTIQTPEGQPAGLDPPDILVASSTSVDIFWSPPDKPNGEILFYGLIRSDQTKQDRIYMGKGDNFHMSDYWLSPGATYQYFLIMGNSIGNISSGSSAVTMPYRLPSNIPPPKNVTVLSATEIYVEWNYFSSSEGFIDQYRVLLNPGRPDQIIIGVGLNLSKKVTGLTPFTTYDVRVQGCLQDQPLGCGSSPGRVVQTYEAPPYGLAGPHVESVASNIVDISWEPPKFPNGIITQYLVYYKTPGSQIELLINRVDGETFQVRHAGPELKPFFEYEYKVVGGNSKGDVSSSWTRVRTLEAPPTGLPQPVVTVTGAFSINLQWQHPAQPNGIITKYTFVYKIVERDPTVPMVNLSLSVIGNTTNTSISGLRPYADYQLQLQALNRAGSTTTSWVNFKTNESSPSGLGLFDIEKIDTGTSAILRWGAPVHPNGIITTYRIYEGDSSVAVFQGLNQQFELRRLQPYTDYTVQLEACTTAGCTRSVLQTFRSAEIPPSDQSSPLIGEVTSNKVTLTWTRPGNANGLITMYEVLRKSNPRIQKRSLSDPVVIYRTMDTATSSYQYTDTNLQPFTEYQYSIRAVNTQGSTQSPWQTAFTQQAPPDGVDPPIVTYLDSNVNALNIKWIAPLKPNGIIQSYQLQRNGSVLFSFSPLDKKEFNDTGLTAYTWYNYTITVCSGGGCTTSEPTLFRTKESAPLSVSPPTVVAINSTAIRVTWTIPQITNGEISIYQLKMDGIIVFKGLQLLYVLGNLLPYHEYSFRLVACTKGGCVESGQVVGITEDDSPQGMLPPALRIMTATSIEVSWLPPEFPNGIITSYDVRRDGRLIYTQSIGSTGSLSTTYTDYNLNPGTKYSYVVTARNRKGSTESPPSLAMTFSSSPSGLDPPTLYPLTATSIQAIWQTPGSPNGVIKNYTLYRDGEMVYAGGPEQLSYIVPGLQFWTSYSFRVQACTDRGCQLSTPASARTLEAIPEGQRSPQLRALADQNGAHTGILVTWESPQKPNGIVKTYEVYRRQLIKEGIGVSYGPTKLVYNGSQLQYTDQSNELQPFTDYQYSVTSVNSVGKLASLWETVQTKQASPAAVLPPIVMETTLSTISVTITPPAVPNGVVYNYNVLVNGTVVSVEVLKI
ncbi:hypothetical protein CHS0354_015758 [Potamilus streckersoni]|uniref:Fibronectin type-III domain-containing protein n=1 Tax=Potamilus streckersoni TaxID=2493646 RepID=A0AAE0T3D9_9BIVA|nr:hypothetical protein CHS0354_015758 [Potamilus streckersoni]